ncbi:hypothetical protein [Agrococcus jejuensis]|uniref:Uncharacterized protein n=1 Tax=Agrococcus jejuensis TaxID=399736 RepID=A0A1G8CUW8_9MICO|nr:hypothetical protein [Agrococcus jejuensis]SDH48949.1 hypothetical protein SAMN04489720_1410 [Agrococcus jejuensis]
MRASRRGAAPAFGRALPLVACAAVAAALLTGCAEGADAGGGVDLLSGGGESAGAWPSSVPRPDLPLIEETDLIIAFSATYDLQGGSVDDYAAELMADGFAEQGASTYGDGSHVVLLEVEGDRLFVTITDA